MFRHKVIAISLSILVGLAGLGLGGLYLLFRRDYSAATARLARGHSQVIDTACGPIEFVEFGNGDPVLVVHGAGGGWDQGASMAHTFVGGDFHFIVPSRFGYLSTPLPEVASPAAQADAHACLLDALGIKRVSVVGMSAGALSTLQFALRYPERIDRIVLFSPDAYVPGRPIQELPKSTETLMQTFLKSDFLIWWAMKTRLPIVEIFYGVPKEVEAALSAEEKASLQASKDSLLPVSRRAPGMVNDAKNSAALERYSLEEIQSPALIIVSADDPTHTAEYGKYTATHLAHGHLVDLGSGGHLLFGKHDRVRAESAGFLK